jgi:hypothetical protein
MAAIGHEVSVICHFSFVQLDGCFRSLSDSMRLLMETVARNLHDSQWRLSNKRALLGWLFWFSYLPTKLLRKDLVLFLVGRSNLKIAGLVKG